MHRPDGRWLPSEVVLILIGGVEVPPPSLIRTSLPLHADLLVNRLVGSYVADAACAGDRHQRGRGGPNSVPDLVERIGTGVGDPHVDVPVAAGGALAADDFGLQAASCRGERAVPILQPCTLFAAEE